MMYPFYGKLGYFDWILNLENIATVTRQNQKESALGKAQGVVINASIHYLLIQAEIIYNVRAF